VPRLTPPGRGRACLLRSLFLDSQLKAFGTLSPHVSLVWALENIAWSGDYMSRAAHVLAHRKAPVTRLRMAALLLQAEPLRLASDGQLPARRRRMCRQPIRISLSMTLKTSRIVSVLRDIHRAMTRIWQMIWAIQRHAQI
jgi:hypothetical protein